ncbi:MAG: hypothetical protein GY720_20360 [bacterium]|nr:hypothetical protein [bacterium]
MHPMDRSPIVVLAKAIRDQYQPEDTGVEPWAEDGWETRLAEMRRLIAVETSRFRLGEVLRMDAGLDMPVEVVIATYDRLFELGVRDDNTRLCYSSYLLLHRERLEEAEAIRAEVIERASAAGLIDNETLGHHPVFYGGEW